MAAGLVGLTALGAFLRASTLDARSFWLDEVFTVQLLDGSFGHMLETIPATEATPPLYYLLAWAWTQVAGVGEVGVRSLSALVGTAVVPIAYLAGKELFTRRIGLAAAALTAVNPLLVWVSQDARAYALVTLLSALSFLFFVRARQGRSGALAWWSLTSALAVGTHYFALLFVVVEGGFLLRSTVRRSSVALALVPAVAVLAALAPLALEQASYSGRAAWIEAIPLAWRLMTLLPVYAVGFETPYPYLVTAGAAVLTVIGIWLLAARADRRERNGALIAAGVGLGTIGLALAAAIAGVDYFYHRNLITVVVPLLLVLAAGLGTRRAGLIGPTSLVAVAVLSLGVILATAWEPKFHREAWRDAAEAIGSTSGSRAIVTTDRAVRPFKLYLDAKPLRGGASLDEVVVLSFPPFDAGTIERPGPAQPPAEAAPAPGLELVERRDSEAFTMLRFRSETARALTPAMLASGAAWINDPTPAILLDR